jgi:hypothetical protein
MIAGPSLPALLESFFTQRLVQQRQASKHTIVPTATLSACCSSSHSAPDKSPSRLSFEEIDARWSWPSGGSGEAPG